jgi:hypothetical protein
MYRTMIPVLLTLALILAIGAVWFGFSPAIGGMFPSWAPFAMGVLALVSLGLGIVNILIVRAEQDRRAV